MNTPEAMDEEELARFCYQCRREVVDGHWFARIKVGDRRVVFCRPQCVERFLEAEAPAVSMER